MSRVELVNLGNGSRFLSRSFTSGLPASIPPKNVTSLSCSPSSVQVSVFLPALASRRFQSLPGVRSEEHTSELQSLMRISYAVFCLKTKTEKKNTTNTDNTRR